MDHTYNFSKDETQPKILAIVLAEIALIPVEVVIALVETVIAPTETVIAPTEAAVAPAIVQAIDTCPKVTSTTH